MKYREPFCFLKFYHCVGLQGIHSFICVLLVITVTVCLAVTQVQGQDPGHALCTAIELTLEQAVRVTAYPAHLVHTVTAQV